ncbi:MAG: SDR family NAD(P)-dependent oxidoreductase [Haloferacaceae archaeon]
MRLEDTTIVVTGGSGGLGKAMADAFVAEGARVVIAGRTESKLADAVDSFDGPGEATGVRADVRSPEDVEGLVAGARDAYGAVDVFVNNAGVTGQIARGSTAEPPVAEFDLETWDTVLDTNLRGAFLCARAVLPGMLEADDGRLIHISSGMGTSGKPGRAAYVASKHGLEGLAKTIALEVADTGVDSLVLRPPGGGVHTGSRSQIGRTAGDATHEEPDVIGEAAVQLAAGAGENGGRYVGRADGSGFDADD